MSQAIVLFPPTAEMPTPAHLRCGPSADEPTVSAQPEHVAVREMPSLFRLVSIKYSQVAPRRFRYGATLFADGQDVRVAWECAQPDTRLNPGVLVAAALATRRILLPEIKHLGLLHCLTAGVGADFLGIRRPATLEAEILSLADRLSGDSDLFRQNAREQPGLGRYHNHLQGRPFLMEGARVD